jgi:hypothetical protein
MLRTCGCWFLLTLFAAAQAGQPAKPRVPTPEERWLQPAQRMTTTIESELFRLPRPMQAVAMAQLAAIWWKQEPVSARKWAGTAVDTVTQAPQNEADIDRTQRIRAARLVLPLVTPLDEGLRQRIVDAMAANVPPGPQSTPAQRANFSSSMVSTAMADKEHPDRLARAISDSMQYAVTGSTIRGLIELRESNPEQADILFQRAVSMSGDLDSGFIFQRYLWPPSNEKPMPPEWRQSSFALLARVLSVTPNNPDEQKKRCDLAGQFVGRHNDQPPELAQAAITARTASCPTYQPTPDQAADNEVFRRRSPKTADDFLAVAAELKNPDNRAQMKYNAAMRAELDDKDPERGVKILDDVTPEEWDSRGGLIPKMRRDFAVRAAMHEYEEGQTEPALKIIDTSPAETRAYIAINFLQKETKKTPPSAFYELAVREVKTHPPEDPLDFVRMINLALKRGDMSDIEDVVAEMDRWREHDMKTMKANQIFFASPWELLTPLPFGPELASVDAATIATKFAAAAKTTSLHADLQLCLVRAWVGRYATEAARTTAEQKKD